MTAKQHRKLVIIESPAKARSLRSYLGSGWDVIASNGHIRDLPLNRMGINLETLEPLYTILPDKRATVEKLRKTAAGYVEVFLAADPDREGEAICWHLASLLDDGRKRFRRIRFNSITREAVQAAASSPSEIDMSLVDAQQARRVMDRLVGYRVSPYLWRTVGKGLSAGRVQSVALRMIVEREKEIQAFKPVEYWPVTAVFSQNGNSFSAKLHKIGSKRADGEKYSPSNGTDANDVRRRVTESDWGITGIHGKTRIRKPSPPFITSSLQVTASNRLSMSPSVSMRTAQDLYEGVDIDGETTGLITYMRTDSVRIEPAAIEECRGFIEEKWGAGARSPKPRRFRSGGGAQDAHEAVRPTDVRRTPESLESVLDPRQLKLYRLIWQRFVATQMQNAEVMETDVILQGGEITFKASGQSVVKPGFSLADPYQLKVTSPIPDGLEEGEASLLECNTCQKFTRPASRFSEASLISEMKKNGIGRPSTYVSIIATLRKRGYAELESRLLAPSQLGMVTTELLVSLFPHIFQVGFTANMEELLDLVAAGKKSYAEAVNLLYEPLAVSLEAAMNMLPQVKANMVVETEEKCPKCGRNLKEKIGRYGKFLACGGFPDCRYTAPIGEEEQESLKEPCPQCESPLRLRKGQYGRYAACSSAECDYKGPVPTGVPCPRQGCGGRLVERQTRRGKTFYSCTSYPACDYALWNRPIDRTCPRCGFPILEERKKGVFCPNCRKKID